MFRPAASMARRTVHLARTLRRQRLHLHHYTPRYDRPVASRRKRPLKLLTFYKLGSEPRGRERISVYTWYTRADQAAGGVVNWELKFLWAHSFCPGRTHETPRRGGGRPIAERPGRAGPHIRCAPTASARNEAVCQAIPSGRDGCCAGPGGVPSVVYRTYDFCGPLTCRLPD